jgi:hypothetical protein
MQQKRTSAYRIKSGEGRTFNMHRRIERPAAPLDHWTADHRSPIPEWFTTQAAELVTDALQPSDAVNLSEIWAPSGRITVTYVIG